VNNWPNFFIVGAPRAGTTTLYDILKRTDGIFMSTIKEPHYFSKSDPSLMYPPPIRDKKKYLALFKNVKNEQVIGEASTSYLWDPSSPKLIHDVIPRAKIIIILRDPIERAFSHFLLRKSHGKTYSFSEAIRDSLNAGEDYYRGELINGGYYAVQTKRYLTTFGPENVLVLIFEEFFNEPKTSAKGILNFLDIDAETVDNRELVHNYLTQPRGKIATSILQNKFLRKLGRDYVSESTAEVIVRRVLGKKIAKPKMLENDREFLKKIYKNDVKDLQNILHRDFPWSL